MAINPAILAAMKAKSEAIQAQRNTPKVVAAMEAKVPKGVPLAGSTGAKQAIPQPVEISANMPNPACLYIDLNPKTGTIEARFDGSPTNDQINQLVACGLSLGMNGVYSGIDTGKVRADLSREFGANFEDEPIPVEIPEKVLAIAGDIPETPKVVPADSLKGKAKLDIVVADDLDDEPNEVSKLTGFELFRRQTDELLEHFEMVRPGTRPADLMLIAIDALHKSTLGRN